MWIGLVCLLLTMAYTFYLRKGKKKTGFTGKRWVVIYLIEILGLALSIGVGIKDWQKGTNRLEKSLPGEGSYTQELHVISDVYEGEVTVEVPERQVSKEDAGKLFKQAIAEIDQTVWGEAQNMDQVTEDLKVRDHYADGMVKARWDFSSDLISSDGDIRQEEVVQDHVVTATVYLTCSPYEEIYEFSFHLYPEGLGSKEGFEQWLKGILEEQDPESAEWILPDEVKDSAIQWKKEDENTGAALSVLGVVAMFAIAYSSSIEDKRRKRERMRELQSDYPSIVSKLVMFLGAGISLPETVERISRDYEQRQRKWGRIRPGYELVRQLHYEMKDGIGELSALEHFGNAAGRKEYRKLSLLLQQNQKKGNEDLLLRLEGEEAEAFEIRKNLAIKLGEEASTKMLLPLLGMLTVVIVIVIAPAMMQMQGM